MLLTAITVSIYTFAKLYHSDKMQFKIYTHKKIIKFKSENYYDTKGPSQKNIVYPRHKLYMIFFLRMNE